MHEFAFADAARPLPVVCLRLPLLTYTIGHELRLIQTRNPILCLPEDEFNDLPPAEQNVALRRAVLICTRNEAQQDRRSHFVRFWAWWCNRFCIYPLELAHFRNYLSAAHAEFPPPSERADDICASKYGYEPMSAMRGRSYGSPHLARLINFSLQHFRFSAFQHFNDAPYALTNQLYVAHLESSGSCRVQNRQEYDEMVNWDKIVAEAKAEEEAESRKQKAESGKTSGLASKPPEL